MHMKSRFVGKCRTHVPSAASIRGTRFDVFEILKSEIFNDPVFEWTDYSRQWMEKVCFLYYRSMTRNYFSFSITTFQKISYQFMIRKIETLNLGSRNDNAIQPIILVVFTKLFITFSIYIIHKESCMLQLNGSCRSRVLIFGVLS